MVWPSGASDLVQPRRRRSPVGRGPPRKGKGRELFLHRSAQQSPSRSGPESGDAPGRFGGDDVGRHFYRVRGLKKRSKQGRPTPQGVEMTTASGR